MAFNRWVVLLVAGLIGSVTFAKEITLEEASQLALENNLDLKGMRDQIESLRSHASQSLAPNSPTLSFSKNDMAGLSVYGTPASEQTQLQWTIGFPGKAFATSSGFKHQAEGARQDALGKEIDLLVQLASNYVAHSANQQMDKFLKEEIQKAKDLIQLQERKFSLGQAAQADILNSRVVLSRLEQDLLNNDSERVQLDIAFQNLLGMPENSEIKPKFDEAMQEPPEVPGLEKLKAYMQKNRPDMKSAQEGTAAAESALHSAQLQALPDFQLSAGMNEYKNPNAAPVQGLNRDYNMGIAVTIPLFFPVNEYTGIKAARSDHAAAMHKQAATEIADLSGLTLAYTSLALLRREAKQMEQIVIPAARASYELSLKTYSYGKADFLSLNDARSTYVQSEKDFVLKKRDLAQTYYQLVETVGCDFMNATSPHACQ